MRLSQALATLVSLAATVSLKAQISSGAPQQTGAQFVPALNWGQLVPTVPAENTGCLTDLAKQLWLTNRPDAKRDYYLVDLAHSSLPANALMNPVIYVPCSGGGKRPDSEPILIHASMWRLGPDGTWGQATSQWQVYRSVHLSSPNEYVLVADNYNGWHGVASHINNGATPTRLPSPTLWATSPPLYKAADVHFIGLSCYYAVDGSPFSDAPGRLSQLSLSYQTGTTAVLPDNVNNLDTLLGAWVGQGTAVAAPPGPGGGAPGGGYPALALSPGPPPAAPPPAAAPKIPTLAPGAIVTFSGAAAPKVWWLARESKPGGPYTEVQGVSIATAGAMASGRIVLPASLEAGNYFIFTGPSVVAQPGVGYSYAEFAVAPVMPCIASVGHIGVGIFPVDISLTLNLQDAFSPLSVSTSSVSVPATQGDETFTTQLTATGGDPNGDYHWALSDSTPAWSLDSNGLLHYKPGGSSSVLNFGQQPVGQTATRAFLFTNVSPAPIKVGAAVAKPMFKVDASACPVPPATLAKAQSCLITVGYTPIAAGANDKDTLIIAGLPKPVAIPLNGSGTAAPAAPVASAVSAVASIGPSGPELDTLGVTVWDDWGDVVTARVPASIGLTSAATPPAPAGGAGAAAVGAGGGGGAGKGATAGNAGQASSAAATTPQTAPGCPTVGSSGCSQTFTIRDFDRELFDLGLGIPAPPIQGQQYTITNGALAVEPVRTQPVFGFLNVYLGELWCDKTSPCPGLVGGIPLAGSVFHNVFLGGSESVSGLANSVAYRYTHHVIIPVEINFVAGEIWQKRVELTAAGTSMTRKVRVPMFGFELPVSSLVSTIKGVAGASSTPAMGAGATQGAGH